MILKVSLKLKYNYPEATLFAYFQLEVISGQWSRYSLINYLQGDRDSWQIKGNYF